MLCTLVRLEFSTSNRNAFLQCVSDGGDINYRMPQDDSNTPLHLAIISRNLDWIHFVLENGADLKIKNKDGKTAMQLAEESKNLSILIFFEQAMIDVNNVTGIDFQDITGEWVPTNNKILVIKKCPSFHDFVELSQQHLFQDVLNAESLIIVVVYFKQRSSIDECELMPLNEVCRKAMILQMNSESSDTIFCKSQDEDFKKLSIKEDPMTVTDARFSDCFNFEFVCNLKYHDPNTFGIFKSNLLQTRMFNEASIDGLRLIEYAIRHQDILVLKFLLLFKPDFHTQNGNNQRILEMAVTESTLKVFKILLEFREESENDNIKLEAKKQKALNLISHEGKSLLMIAVEREEPEMIKFLIKYGLRFTSAVSECINAFESALEIKDYILAMDILQADGTYPDYFDFQTLNDVPENLKMFILSSENFHKAIKNNNKTTVEEFIAQNPKTKFAYNIKNVSAMSTALIARQFDIYSYLQSKGFSNGADANHDEILKSLDYKDREALKKDQGNYFRKSDSLHIMELLTKSSIGSDNELENFKKIQTFYEALDEIPELQTILKTVASSKNIKIVFDFNRDSVCGLYPTVLDEGVKGCTYDVDNLILIGAKREKDAELLGILTHEFTHYAIEMCYNNQCEPFTKDDHDRKTKFNEIVEKSGSKEFKNKSRIIDTVFACYDGDERSSELIV